MIKSIGAKIYSFWCDFDRKCRYIKQNKEDENQCNLLKKIDLKKEFYYGVNIPHGETVRYFLKNGIFLDILNDKL